LRTTPGTEPEGSVCVRDGCHAPVMLTELLIPIEWCPEKLDWNEKSREEQHSLRAHQPECTDTWRDSSRTSP